jgi:hypothetical protein
MDEAPGIGVRQKNNTNSYAFMQTSITPTQILFIDGLPGSGKSTAAEAVGRRLSHGRIFLESDPDHPLLAATPDRMGAAFADIHKIHSWESFAAAALRKLESFLESTGCDVLYVFESHPIQSTVRVLFQLDAPQPMMSRFWSDLQDRLAIAQPRLIYFQESNPLQAMQDIARMRGPSWESYLIEALKQSPWMRARALSGIDGVNEMLVEYAKLVDQLADSWRFPILTLPARPENYQLRTHALTKWAAASA